MELISFRGEPPLEVPDDLANSRGSTRVELADGRSVSVRTVRLAPGADPQSTWDELRRLADVGGNWLARPLAARLDQDSVTIAEETPNGVSLRVLRRLVPLTFDQAAVIGDGLLGAVAALERRQTRHRSVSLDTVFIGSTDGRVRLVAPDPRPDPSGSASDLEEAAELVRGLLQPSSEQGHHAVPAAVRDSLLELLSPAGLADRRPASVSARWRQVLRGHLDRSGTLRVRRQLQALAARLEGQREARARLLAAPPVLEPAPVLAGPGRGAAAATGAVLAGGQAALPGEVVAGEAATPPASGGGPRPPAGRSRVVVRRRAGWAWLGAAAAIALLLAAGGTLLVLRAAPHQRPVAGSRTARPTPGHSISPTPSPSPVSSPRPSPSSTPPPLLEIPLLAPASNPPITGVELSASCPPSGYGDCSFTMTANLGTHSSDTVGWRLELVNRCTGSVSEVASGEIPAPAYYTYVEAQPQADVPATTPVGVVALAGAPNLAASAPLLITPPGSSCPT